MTIDAEIVETTIDAEIVENTIDAEIVESTIEAEIEETTIDAEINETTVEAEISGQIAYVGSSPVNSVFGRTGAVVSAYSDYKASQISDDSSIGGNSVSDALGILESEKIDFNDVIDCGTF